MEIINKNGEEGVFIPLNEFDKGKFFNEKELQLLQRKILAQKESINILKKELER